MTDARVFWNGKEYVINFSEDERQALHSLAEQMRSMIVENDPDTYRLFPPAYMNDVIKQEEYRSYMSDELMKSHLVSLDVLDEVSMCATLHEDDMYGMLRAVNDTRLVLGTRLDIDEDTEVGDISDDHPDIGLYALYMWLDVILYDVLTAMAHTVSDFKDEDEDLL